MFYLKPFNLNKDEIELAYKANNIFIKTNWCQEGKMQEKGKLNEFLILDLLSLCEVEVLNSKVSSVLDEVLKVDILCKHLDELEDVFAFQVKSSEYGAKQHYIKNGEEIEYDGYYFRTPWCLIVDGSKNNAELLDLLIEELYLVINLDFYKLEEIVQKVLLSNSKTIRKDSVDRLSSKEIKALRLLYNIGCNNKTLFLK